MAIGRITTGGAITNYALPDGTIVVGITADRHGNLWFADNFTDPNSYATKEAIGRITPQGRIRMFAVPFPKDAQSPELDAIATGPDGNVYFTADYRGQNNNKDHSFFGQITAWGHIRLTALSVSTSSSTYPNEGSYADDVTSLISGPNGSSGSRVRPEKRRHRPDFDQRKVGTIRPGRHLLKPDHRVKRSGLVFGFGEYVQQYVGDGHALGNRRDTRPAQP